jgi:hypothetical protein
MTGTFILYSSLGFISSSGQAGNSLLLRYLMEKHTRQVLSGMLVEAEYLRIILFFPEVESALPHPSLPGGGGHGSPG